MIINLNIFVGGYIMLIMCKNGDKSIFFFYKILYDVNWVWYYMYNCHFLPIGSVVYSVAKGTCVTFLRKYFDVQHSPHHLRKY